MATLEDIAKRLGISKGTVSKALNGREDISEAMRKSILETAVEMGYTRREKGRRICVFTNFMKDPDVEDQDSDLILGFRQAAEPSGYRVRVIPLTEILQWRFQYDEFMVTNNYAGAFFTDIGNKDPWIDCFEDARTPAVLYNGPVIRNLSVTTIGFDDYEGMDRAVFWLQDLGHEKIGYLGGLPDDSVFCERRDIFLKAMRENGLDCSAEYTGTASSASECLEQHFQRLIDLGCTALICSDDLLAYDVMNRCNQQGLRIPGDLSIVGINDLPKSEIASPPLSSIRQDRQGLGKAAFLALAGHFSNAPVSRITLHSELIRRASCGKAGSDF